MPSESGAEPVVTPVIERGRKRRGGLAHRMHRPDFPDGVVDQRRASNIEQREQVEIRCQAKTAGDTCGQQSADQIAGDIPRDVRRERSPGIHRAALLAKIGQRQRESRCHA